MTKEQFCKFDIFFFSVLAMVSEYLGYYLCNQWSVGFSLSLASLIAIIGIFRWGYVASIIYIVAGLPIVILEPSNLSTNLLYYIVASTTILIVPLILYRQSYNSIISSPLLFNIVIILICLSIVFGKGLILIILGYKDGMKAFFSFFLFTIVINLIISNLLKRHEGLIFNMNSLNK